MEANSSKSGALPPRNPPDVVSTASHPKPPTHPPVPPQRCSDAPAAVLPPLDTQQFHSPPASATFRALRPAVSMSLPSSPGSIIIGTSTPTIDSADLRRQAMANATRMAPPPHRLDTAHDAGSSSVRFTPEDREAAMIFRSQPIPGGPPHPARLASGAGGGRGGGGGRSRPMNWDRRYDSFKTAWSGKLERQITHLAGGFGFGDRFGDHGDDGEDDVDSDVVGSHRTCATSVPEVDRFYAALEGPELDQLKPSEDLVLPSDMTWPFLLRFPVSSFGICMGVSSQAILWKAISSSAHLLPPTLTHVTATVNLVLWLTSVALTCAVATVYACKLVFYFEAVRREYYHPIRVNFFFAPWITFLYPTLSLPLSLAPPLSQPPPKWLWYLLMAPLLCLDLKIYGQWMSGGERRLSKVANPSNHLSVLGNFVGAQLGAAMGLREGPVFFFAVELAHYLVLFVTLYQRLPTNETLPRDLHPVFFLFVAAPSVSAVAWAEITAGGNGGEEFGGHVSRIAFFVAMFLYASLGVRVNFFRGFRFSLAWWAYTSPMAGAAVAAIRYAAVVDNAFTKGLCVALSVVATLTAVALFVTTVVHGFVPGNLFPNDIAIAITERKVKPIVELQERDGNGNHHVEATDDVAEP